MTFVPNGRRTYVTEDALGFTRLMYMTVNQARAMRIAEIMDDFRSIQHAIANLRATPSSEEYNAEGYQLLRQCIAEAQAVLAMPYNGSAVQTRGNVEQEKTQLRQCVSRLSFS